MKASTTIGTVLTVAVITVGVMASTPDAGAEEAADRQPSAGSVPEVGVVAFYFHGNVRCATCRKIEAYADDAIHSAFAAELEAGALTWKTVNVDEAENKHFIDDFNLTTRSIVLAEYRGGKAVRFKNLSKIWQLVRSEDRFTEYVQGEAREFLDKS